MPTVEWNVIKCIESDQTDHIGKWFFKVRVTIPEVGMREFGPVGPLDSELKAKVQLEDCCRMILKSLQEDHERDLAP